LAALAMIDFQWASSLISMTLPPPILTGARCLPDAVQAW
jgi:hypothetical protein